MKRLITSILMASVIGVVADEPDSRTISVSSKIGTTNTVADIQDLQGKVHAIDFNMVNTSGTAATGSCAIVVSSGNMTLFNGTILASGIYYPRVPVHGLNGIALGGTSNAYERIFLVQDRVTVKAIEGAGVTNVVNTRVMLDK